MSRQPAHGHRPLLASRAAWAVVVVALSAAAGSLDPGWLRVLQPWAMFAVLAVATVLGSWRVGPVLCVPLVIVTFMVAITGPLLRADAAGDAQVGLVFLFLPIYLLVFVPAVSAATYGARRLLTSRQASSSPLA